MRVLVSGANGFVGGEVIARLADSGFETAGIYRESGISQSFDAGVVIADLADSGTRDLNLRGFDAVVHCAGLAHQPFGTPAAHFIRNNRDAAENLAIAAAAAKVKRFIHISSVSVYGKASYGGFIDEEVECRPTKGYAQSKHQAETLLKRVFEGTNTDLVILRPSTVIGEGDRGNIATLIRYIDRGRFVFIGNGQNLKSFVHKSDLAEAVSVIVKMQAGISGVYNVTSDPITVNDVVDTICKGLGRKPPKFRLPGGLISLLSRSVSKMIPLRQFQSVSSGIGKWISEDAFSGEKLSRYFVPALTAKEALRREVAWYRGIK